MYFFLCLHTNSRELNSHLQQVSFSMHLYIQYLYSVSIANSTISFTNNYHANLESTNLTCIVQVDDSHLSFKHYTKCKGLSSVYMITVNVVLIYALRNLEFIFSRLTLYFYASFKFGITYTSIML